MNLTRSDLDAWADKQRAAGKVGTFLLRLDAGDTVPMGMHGAAQTFVANEPTVVQVVVYRDYGWTIVRVETITPAQILGDLL